LKKKLILSGYRIRAWERRRENRKMGAILFDVDYISARRSGTESIRKEGRDAAQELKGGTQEIREDGRIFSSPSRAQISRQVGDDPGPRENGKASLQ